MVEEGLSAVTFDGLSRRTGISRTTLYRHWPRPVDLVIETFERLTEPEPVPVTDDLAADLRTIYRAARDGLEHGVWRRLVPSLIAAADVDPDLEDLHARFIAERRRPVLERLRRAVQDGEVRADADLDLAVDLMTAPLFYRRLLRHEHTPDAVVGQVVDVVVDRLRRA